MEERLKLAEVRKKERIQKLKGSNDIAEELKVAIDPLYKKTAEAVEKQAEMEKIATVLLKKDVSIQEESYKAKLAARKEKIKQKYSMLSGDDLSGFLQGINHPGTAKNFKP